MYQKTQSSATKVYSFGGKLIYSVKLKWYWVFASSYIYCSNVLKHANGCSILTCRNVNDFA